MTRQRRKTLKLVALGYVVKTLLLGALWLVIPELPRQAMTKVLKTWSRLSAVL